MRLNNYVYQEDNKAHFYSLNDNDSKYLCIAHCIQIKSLKIQDKEVLRILYNKWDEVDSINYMTLFLI